LPIPGRAISGLYRPHAIDEETPVMKTPHRLTVAIVCLLACTMTSVVAQNADPAQPASDPPASGQPASQGTSTYGADRLFLQFERDAAIIPHQWWEGQIVFTGSENIDATVAQLVFALAPAKKVEVGGRVGFGTTNTASDLPDGSGATDLEVWGKWAGTMGASGKTELAFGGILNVPTGDDTAGLGTDSWNVAVYGAFRHPLRFAVLTWNIGFRANDDGSVVGIPIKGKNSFFIGGGFLWPISDQFTFVGELVWETERFEPVTGQVRSLESFDDDARVLGGINWRPFNTGMFRGAIAAGLTDGAPDWQLYLTYAYNF
jgi:hypothetical protein